MRDLRVAGMNIRFTLAALLTLGWVAGCSDTSTDPTVDPLPEGLMVSDPGPAAAAVVAAHSGPSLASSQADNLVYVSLSPATAPGGVTATMTNLSSGQMVTTAIQDGGFDPTPVVANTGDLIEVVVRDVSGAVVAQPAPVRVAARRAPGIVRTTPPHGKRDVSLNCIIGIVFTEPVDESSLTPSSVELLHGTTPVPGTVSLLQGAATTAIFTPAAPLDPNTQYQLRVTQAVRDLQGDHLAVPVTVDFTTGTTLLSAVTVVRILGAPVYDTVAGMAAGTTAQLVAVPYDANYAVIAGRPATWSSSDQAVATVSGTGLFRALSSGYAVITATVDGVLGRVGFRVQ